MSSLNYIVIEFDLLNSPHFSIETSSSNAKENKYLVCAQKLYQGLLANLENLASFAMLMMVKCLIIYSSFSCFICKCLCGITEVDMGVNFY